MSQTISRKDLCGYLSLLRRELNNEKTISFPNLIFLNSRAFYHFLAGRPCGKDTIGGILKKIEPCIPLAVTEESFSLFLSACQEPAAARTRSFLENSKADFLLMVCRSAQDEDQWQALVALCESLRQKNMT